MSKVLDLDIGLQSKQKWLYNYFGSDRFEEFLLYGSSRSGKTFLIIYWMIVQAVVYEANCLVMRATFTSLQNGMLNQTLPTVLKIIAKLNGKNSIDKVIMSNGRPFCSMNNKLNTLTFYNGAYIQFASLRGAKDNATAYDKVLSTEWCHIFLDEVSEIDEAAVDVLRSRLSQKVDGVTNKFIFALNPTTKLHWTYVRFFKHENRDGEKLKEDIVRSFKVVKFTLNDNKDHVSKNYERGLDNMSTAQQTRFKYGDYADDFEGEIFKSITWGEKPSPEEFKACIIYTDPSAKDQKTNDYKASVLLGLARNKIWLINARAVQGTSYEMIRNIHELYLLAPVTPKMYIENKQLPLDFRKTFDIYCDENDWICSYIPDNRNNGDKYTNIESTLEPLFRDKKFIFCHDMNESGVCEIAKDQFLRFSRKEQKDRKDDIPDACAKGTSILLRLRPMQNINQSTGQTVLIPSGRRTRIC